MDTPDQEYSDPRKAEEEGRTSAQARPIPALASNPFPALSSTFSTYGGAP